MDQQEGSCLRFLENTECIYGLGFWLPLQEGFHLALPDWTNGTVYPDALTQLTALSFEINVMTREMQRIKGGNQFCFTSPTKTEKRLLFFCGRGDMARDLNACHVPVYRLGERRTLSPTGMCLFSMSHFEIETGLLQ